MSTKQTIKRGDGFHLYTSDMSEEAGMLYLGLTDCDFAVYAADGRTGVTVKLTEDVARRLGLIGCTAKWRT